MPAKNRQTLYRTASLVFFVCFGIYILFSRQPDYFSSDVAKGVLVNTKGLSSTVLQQNKIERGDYPVIKYVVGSQQFYLNASGNVLAKIGIKDKDIVVIYEADYPEVASIYKGFGYWLVLDELITCLVIYAVLFAVAIAVTGKNKSEASNAGTAFKQTKYS